MSSAFRLDINTETVSAADDLAQMTFKMYLLCVQFVHVATCR